MGEMSGEVERRENWKERNGELDVDLSKRGKKVKFPHPRHEDIEG
jgi:hypothetical protein